MHRDLVGAGVGQTRDRHRRRRSGVEGKVGVQKVVLGGGGNHSISLETRVIIFAFLQHGRENLFSTGVRQFSDESSHR